VFSKLPFRGAEAGEIEPQNPDPLAGEPLRDAFRRQDVLSAGEAMREQRVAPRRPLRQVEARREFMPVRAGECGTD